ncbi:hypothetical protein SHL15_9179 [Streptomyces hygroscopicus subsp. limoneus]|nr:hypothetical protein SHL15_9179 [Streptomyces hygroscopicus subsp. limoneus]
MQAAHQVVQLGDRLLRLAVRLVDHLAGVRRQVAEGGPGQAQVDGERDEALLRAVVQVALDPPPLGVGGVEHTGPALGEVGDPAGQLLRAAGAEQDLGRPGLQPHQSAGQPGPEEQQGEAAGGDVRGLRGVPEVGDPPLWGQRPDPHVDGGGHESGGPDGEDGEVQDGEQRTRHSVVADLPPQGPAGQPAHSRLPVASRPGYGGAREVLADERPVAAPLPGGQQGCHQEREQHGQRGQGRHQRGHRAEQPEPQRHHGEVERQAGGDERGPVSRPAERPAQHQLRPRRELHAPNGKAAGHPGAMTLPPGSGVHLSPPRVGTLRD